jgi:beta-galactosidase/beta-glucuronidase
VPTPIQEHHPRPILARTGWTDLCGTWQFAHDDDDAGLADGWAQRTDVFHREITVPFPPESPASGIHDEDYHAVVWYRRTVALSRPEPGHRTVLHFGAVDYRADVWVNGQHQGGHEGGQTPFRLDITDALSETAEQTIVVRAVDDPHDLEQPRGKQDWQRRPHVIWYGRTTGIWQPVWLEQVPDTHVESLQWTPVDGGHAVDVRLRLARRRPRPARVRIRISLDGQPLADDTASVTGTVLTRRITLDDAARFDAEPGDLHWSPEQPTLCAATVTVHTDDAPPDEVHSYIGFRTVGTDDRSFLLNGRPYPLRLALSQGYWPQSHLAAPSADALRTEVELAKQLGFNGVRVHQKVEDPRFLYWCDRLGLLVFADSAAAFTFSQRSLGRTIAEWTQIVARDAGHPCVAGWTAFNESWGVPQVATSPAQRDAVRAVYHLLKALDPSRPVLGNDGWEYVAGDLLGVHDYTHDPSAITNRYRDLATARDTVAHRRPGGRALSLTGRTPKVPIVLSEFGGFTHAPDAADTWTGYGTAESPTDLIGGLAALFDAVHRADGLAGFCYTQLTDTVQERNGLLTEDRKPKAEPEVIAQIVRGDRYR